MSGKEPDKFEAAFSRKRKTRNRQFINRNRKKKENQI